MTSIYQFPADDGWSSAGMLRPLASSSISDYTMQPSHAMGNVMSDNDQMIDSNRVLSANPTAIQLGCACDGSTKRHPES
ncbi:hypothetical protein CERSUDRAFT_88250 [Gelatoporia subvermispora B]|uniref:Uncharacterized protein n=1 Tax=Ceriporiopsis subvermispora (strain B) TaxID=914234 RepID=M2P9V9_CERS8|nr:hypothetical protein CERSUDRAFT_88250 [Gelatoporia subvermispora B]